MVRIDRGPRCGSGMPLFMQIGEDFVNNVEQQHGSSFAAISMGILEFSGRGGVLGVCFKGEYEA